MSILPIEVLSRINENSVLAKIIISSDDLIDKCANDGDSTIFAQDEELIPFQRDAKNSEVNKKLVKCFENYQNALDKGKSIDFACNFLPRGTIVLSTQPGQDLNTTKRFMAIDSRQRLSALKKASNNLGKRIEVTFFGTVVEEMDVEGLAKEFVKYNSRNTITQPELINAAFHYKAFEIFMKKIKEAKKDGFLYGIDIVPNPSSEKDENGLLIKKDFPLHKFLAQLFYAVTKKNNTQFMMEHANEISQEAINSACLMMSIFEETIGYKSFRKGKHQKDCYSSSSYMSALTRLVLNHNIANPKGQLTADGLKYFFNLLTDYDAGKGYDYHQFALSHNTGGQKTFDEVYSSWTSTPLDNSIKMGIIVDKPNKNFKKIFAIDGHAIQNNIDCLDEGVLRENALSSRA